MKVLYPTFFWSCNVLNLVLFNFIDIAVLLGKYKIIYVPSKYQIHQYTGTVLVSNDWNLQNAQIQEGLAKPLLRFSGQVPIMQVR